MEQKVKKDAEEKKEALEEKKAEVLQDFVLSPEMEERLAALEVHEKVMEEKVDNIANQVAHKMGYATMPWLKVTWVLLYAYTAITILIMFYRSDFVNLTVCATALYMLFNTETLTRMRFRMLVLGIFLSIIIDIFWFIIKFKEYTDDPKEDPAANEKNLRRFVLMLSIISFILRVSVGCESLCIDFRSDCVLEGLDGLHEDHPE